MNIKSFTDLEQSKKLSEILPLDSADHCFLNDGTAVKAEINPYNVALQLWKDHYVEIMPAWSLAALLCVLAKETHNIDEDGYIVLSSYKGDWWDVSLINCDSGEIKKSNDPLDAAFEMICWLKENGKI